MSTFKSFNPKRISKSKDYQYPYGQYCFNQFPKENKLAELCANCGYSFGDHLGVYTDCPIKPHRRCRPAMIKLSNL